ncbi:hypothetical protein I79_011649 [Cricetulus griseus]|uniref:Uncharacterized protein n=1 Tax=Cricetulus griseus TaxID=10029 RepID=G3HLQ7_CRIGR|nr:hypothetical protein I79_011649 [Cricetulus griseus]
MEVSGAKSYLNCWGLTQEVPEENFIMLPKYSSCDILVKKVAAFCPGPKESA